MANVFTVTVVAMLRLSWMGIGAVAVGKGRQARTALAGRGAISPWCGVCGCLCAVWTRVKCCPGAILW
ncbi:hypothetical protein [Edwardsiella tarda]